MEEKIKELENFTLKLLKEYMKEENERMKEKIEQLESEVENENS